MILLSNLSLTVSSYPAQNHHITVNEDSYDLVLIAPSRYTQGLQAFIDHKNSLGIPTFFKTLESINNEYTGYDIQEKIKHFIKYAYDTFHITYVLLIGDYEQTPPRYCFNNDSYHNMEPCFISDLYFADLYDSQGVFSSWDTDHDRFYGEWNGPYAEDSNISLTPEIGIGRLPCHNRFELFMMVQKIIRYEKSTAGTAWFTNVVVAGGDTYSAASGYNGSQYHAMEGEVFTEEVLQLLSGCHPVRLWATTGTLTSLNLIKAINAGCGFLYLSGHGSPSVWVSYASNSTKSIGYLSNGMIPFLMNGRKLPICLVSGCENSKFDVHIRDCWSWRLTSAPFGGSIATIGNTGLSWLGMEFGGGGNNWIILQFFKEYVNGTGILGDVWRKAICTYLDTFPINWDTPNGNTSSLDAKTVQEWVLFGDPSLKIGGYETV